jgi:uncharacterized damage-inducible protein DinB
MQLGLNELVRYTDEERSRWEMWFRENGPDLLRMPIAGRDATVGALILHIFGPELRYVQRIAGDPVTEYRGLPSKTVEEVFGFGIETRRALRQFFARAKPEDWDRQIDLHLAQGPQQATVRKLIGHVLIHEIRHWAQIARIMRERGFEPPGGHDLLMSSALE